MSPSPSSIPGAGEGRSEGWRGGDGDQGESQSWSRPSGAAGQQDGLSGGSKEAAGHFAINPAFPLAHLNFNFSAVSSNILSSVERAEMT